MTNNEHFIFSSDSNCYVSIDSGSSYCKNQHFLVDSGASLSACKYKHAQKFNIPIHTEDITIHGLGGKVQAIGYVYLPMVLSNETIYHKFYVFDNLPIKVNGILGRDFLNKYKAKLNFEKSNLTLEISNNNLVTLPIVDDCSVNINIPARSESIHFIETDFTEDCVIISNELKPGVFLASSIATPKNGRIPVRILNVTDSDVLLNNITPSIEKLNCYDICTFKKNNKRCG